MNDVTDWATLRVVAAKRGVADPQNCKIYCGRCGADLGIFGVAHWEDCDGEDDIIFVKQDAKTEEWKKVGSYPILPRIMAFFLGDGDE